MSIIGKFFGFTGPALPADAAGAGLASETALPGYSAWYSQQMARSYARRHGIPVLRYDLLLAA